MNSESLQTCVSNFRIQGSAELNLHLIAACLAIGNLSCRRYLHIHPLAGLSILMLTLKENNFYKLFIFHCPAPESRPADFTTMRSSVKNCFTLALMFCSTCFCKPAVQFTWSLRIPRTCHTDFRNVTSLRTAHFEKAADFLSIC